MSSFDILAKERPLEPRLFLEASAGTGKTFTIEHLVVRLLQETSVTLEQILVVTFTRAATRELKERIRANLDKSVQFDKAQIFTIHGFCQRLLQEFAFEASVGLELSEWTPEEETWAILEFLRQTTCVSTHQLRRLFGKYQNDIEVVVQKLKRSTSKQEIDILAAINRELTTLSFFPIAELFANIRSEYKGMTSLEFGPQAELLQEVLRRQHLTPEEFDKLVGEDDLFLENLTEHHLKVRAKISHPLQLKEFRDRLWPLLEKARNPYPIFQIVANGWHQEKKRLARVYEKISPDDLLEMVQERLSDPAFVKRVREKYRVVIVDEFQDTDPIQWNIFNQLFIQDSTKSIYLVGDPKQSIYAFRKADIYTFLQAGELFAKKAELTTNYRSGPQLISALNRLFCSKPWLDLPKLGQTLVAQPVQAAKKEGGELCFMVTEGHIGRSKQWPTKEIERELFFPFIVHEILRLKLHPGDVAILVKDRYQALRMKEYLQKWKIPSVLNRDISLGESLAIDLIEEVIEACHGTHQISMIKRVMLGPLFQIPIEELTDETVFNTQMAFSELTAIWIEKGIAAFFAKLLTDEVITRLHAHGLYNDVMLVLERIIFIQDPHLAIQTLHELRLQESEDRISIHPHGVQIMTTHASKGLEFETVFALSLASRTTAEETGKIAELDAEKMRQLYVALTRAKTRLYVPLLNETSGKEPLSGEASPMELFWKKVTPNLAEFSHVFLNQMEFILKPFATESSSPILPTIPKTSFQPIYLQSFSSLATKREWKSVEDPTLPPGSETGIIIHTIMERYFEERKELEEIIDDQIKGTHLESYQETLRSVLNRLLDLSLGSFTLRQITNVFPEMEFLFPTGNTYLKGFIDLCVEYEGKYYLIDWKTNVLEDYSPQTIEKAMIDNDYLLQGKIYTEAFRRYLQLYGDLSIEGTFFIFIRGPAFYWMEGNT